MRSFRSRRQQTTWRPPPAPEVSFSQPWRRRAATGRRLVKPDLSKAPTHTPEERLLILDCWQRSKLPAKDFAALVGVSKHTLHAWKKAFAQRGPAGLMEKKRGAKEGSRLPDLTKRTILMLKRQNRRVYLVAFLDDHSRFIVSFGLHASQSTALVLEVLRAGIASYGTPQEVLTDNGAQYITWRGKSAFTKELEKRGIQQIVSRPRHPDESHKGSSRLTCCRGRLLPSSGWKCSWPIWPANLASRKPVLNSVCTSYVRLCLTQTGSKRACGETANGLGFDPCIARARSGV